jgi:hypothetical protein
MTMPGFTSEASLYRTSDYYSISCISTAGANQVVPQLSAQCYIAATLWLKLCLEGGGSPSRCHSIFINDVDYCSR